MKSHKKRSKNGCLTCRGKKKKCDENMPVCGLCLKTNTLCEWPTSRKKLVFLPQNSIHLKDFNNSKNLKCSRKRDIKELEHEDKEKSLYEEGIVPKRNGQLARKKVEFRELAIASHILEYEYDSESISSPDARSNNSYDQLKKEQEKDKPYDLSPKMPQSNNKVEDAMSQGTNLLNTSGLQNTIFNLNERISPSSTINPSFSPAFEYQDLYGTLRDFMFLNAASRDAQSPILIPPDLSNVDIDNYFNDFLNSKNNANLGEMTLGSLPHVVSSTNLPAFSSNMDCEDATQKCQLHKSRSTHLPIKECISNNLIDEIKLDSDYFDLFTNYVEEVAGWLDMFDRKKHFTTVILNLSRESIPLYYSMLALSSRQLDKTGKSDNKERTFALYETSLYYLFPLVSDHSSLEVVASCIILCVFEMMDSCPTNWRKHLKGCAALISASNMHGQGSPLERSLFWCFLRMDICNAIINGEPTLVPLRKWGDLSVIEEGVMDNLDIASAYKKKFLSLSSFDFDMYSNYIVFLAARTVNLIEGGESFIADKPSPESFEKEFVALYHELLEWYINRPILMKPVACHTLKEEFPKLFFNNSPGTSGNQMYHMLMILMNKNKPRTGTKCKLDGIKHPYRNHLNNVWHAKRIIGISLLNIKDHGCLTNALQPIYIAGKVLTGRNEHETILKLLQKIEDVTGWACSWRMDDLIELWNENI